MKLVQYRDTDGMLEAFKLDEGIAARGPRAGIRDV